MRKTGSYETLGDTTYFIPDSLPPKNPPLTLDTATTTLYGQALYHLSKLNEMAQRVPNSHRFINAYVTKEALLSSEIEGVHTTLLNVYTQPLLEKKPDKNTQLVLNYTQALETAIAMITQQGLPLSSRVLLATHNELMSHGHGDGANPGHYRTQSVRVGNFVPPPAPKVPELIARLESFINEDTSLPPLIKAGLAHAQFELIHPFLDGNGRIGRLLIVLMLLESKLLDFPLLYPSYYLKQQAPEYYYRLDRVRTAGDFEGWITFYLHAIDSSSQDAYQRAEAITALANELFAYIDRHSGKGRELRHKALEHLFARPVTTVSSLSQQTGIAYNTARGILDDFLAWHIVTQQTPQKRESCFAFSRYLEILQHDYASH